MRAISARELAQWLRDPQAPAQLQLVDVREPWEFQACHLPGSVLIPMGEIATRIDDIDASRPVVCVCHHGTRSAQVALFLESRGIAQTYNLTGGVDGWAQHVDPAFPRY